MVNCAIKLCRNHAASKTTKLSDITFLCFPKDPVQKRKWVSTCGRDENWIPTKYSRICSAHFRKNDYNISEAGKKILNKDSIPTENLYHKSNEQVLPQSENSTIKVSEDRLVEKRLKYKIEQQKKKIKRLNESVRRKNLRISNLENIIEKLQNQNLITESANVLDKIGIKSKELLKRQIKGTKNGKLLKTKYSPTV